MFHDISISQEIFQYEITTLQNPENLHKNSLEQILRNTDNFSNYILSKKVK